MTNPNAGDFLPAQSSILAAVCEVSQHTFRPTYSMHFHGSGSSVRVLWDCWLTGRSRVVFDGYIVWR